MALAVIAVVAGLALLVWSAERFVEGAAATAKHVNVPSLLIGMVIVGFGTSAPEIVVSAFAAAGGNPGLALGNAFGSNITNIALILGITALISPIAVRSKVLRSELPLLVGVTALAAWLLRDGELSTRDAVVLLVAFAAVMAWSIWRGLRKGEDSLGSTTDADLVSHPMPLKRSVMWLIVGLLLLVVSSRALVWGAVEIAQAAGLSDLFIGLTIVALGTSLPELASSVIAARKGEHEIALGNVLGSNLFNTLAVVGIAGAIRPITADPEVLSRDLPVMAALTLSLFVVGYGFRRGRGGRINRFEGGLLVVAYLVYMTYLVATAFG
ncbi:calcium/sodium antiporter [Jonesia quinghaiensis]|uniref:calcium/sodium antiporter n=1 Tax=Jonesia quinghaiensis TaxID=262806 RepID=UPI0004087CE3|nr:calcium/sodium antiporter [Jonesia quinghaiensis]